jgi:NADH:ubiquinone oxidoreductase subunit F (NADH-binding)/Pyruvate/2-oxoacid:ferredoxin oxidoreductase delta subunit
MEEILINNETDTFLLQVTQLDKVEYTRDMENKLEYLRRDKLTRPLILVSMSTASLVAGAEVSLSIISRYISERNSDAEIIQTGCIGMSLAEPVVSIQMPGRTRLLFSNITEDRIVSLLDDVFHKNIPTELCIGQIRNEKHEGYKDILYLEETDFMKFQNRIILKNTGIIDPGSIEEYIAKGGYKSFVKTIKHYTSEEVCEMVENSGLRGRSGSGYLTGLKWKSAFYSSADQKYLICNAEESDPGAFMDRAIMEGDPHLLIEGMAIAAYGIGATKGIIYIRTEYHQAIKRLEDAIRRAREVGIIGHNILGSGFNFDISLRNGPGAFVCGEETALINSLEGKRGMPQSKPPYPATSGLHRKPTIINNVETLSNVPVIIGKGPKWFNSIGVEGNTGTKIFAISGKIRFPGLIEVSLGTSLRRIVFDIAGGPETGKEFKGIHLGGPSGSVIPVNLLDTPLTFENLKSIGAGLGSGGIIALDEDTCILDMVKYFMDFMQRQSCGKCIPCREGTRRMSEILESISRKPIDENGHTTLERFKGVMQLESLAEVMKDTSLCGLGMSAPNPVLSTLRHFRDEYEEHIFDRKCRSNKCTELRTYYIDVELCTGCSACAKKCPTEAIFGTARHPYFIVEDKCIGCGFCYESCKFSAIYYK